MNLVAIVIVAGTTQVGILAFHAFIELALDGIAFAACTLLLMQKLFLSVRDLVLDQLLFNEYAHLHPAKRARLDRRSLVLHP
jgi:hypothetical protein